MTRIAPTQIKRGPFTLTVQPFQHSYTFTVTDQNRQPLSTCPWSKETRPEALEAGIDSLMKAAGDKQ